MNISFTERLSPSVRNMKNAFIDVNKSIVKLANGKKYNDYSENIIEQSNAKFVKIKQKEITDYMKNIQYADTLANFAYETLSEIKSILTQQLEIFYLCINQHDIKSKNILKSKFLSLNKEIHNIVKNDYNGVLLFFPPNDQIMLNVNYPMKSNALFLKLRKEVKKQEIKRMKRPGKPEKLMNSYEFKIGFGNDSNVKFEFSNLGDGNVYVRKNPSPNNIYIKKVTNSFMNHYLYPDFNSLHVTDAEILFELVTFLSKFRPEKHDELFKNDNDNINVVKEIFQDSIERINNYINEVAKIQNILINAKNNLIFFDETLSKFYSEINDSDITEVSNELVKNIIKMNNAGFAQFYENDALSNIVNLLINKESDKQDDII